MRERLALWLDVRPREVGAVALSFCGAFLAIAFLVLARSVREAFYLARFPVETLPYIMAAVALLSVPSVALFAAAVSRGRPQRVLVSLLVVLGAGLAALWPLVERSPVAVVGFYLWTELGTMLLTSGFWLITAELFPVRGAKRLFGLIGAGGTLGAMVTGNLVALVSSRIELATLVPVLIALLGLFWLVQAGLPRVELEPAAEATPRPGMREGWRSVWGSPHLRTIATIVAVSTVASVLVDYQFKEAARAALDSGEALAGYFGAFYGWAGAAALTLQLFVTGRLLARRGIAVTLGVLPTALLLGSAGILLLPGLVAATLARGADNALRRSLHRSGVEVMYVPVSAELRRKTKTFIDSVADSVAEGLGAAIVFVVVTWAGLPSRLLSFGVIGLAAWFVWLARRARRHYVRTVTSELRDKARAEVAGEDRRELLTASFADVDLRPIDVDLPEAGLVEGSEERAGSRADALGAAAIDDDADVEALLEVGAPWTRDRIEGLTRLLARDAVYHEVTQILAGLEDAALGHLREVLADPEADFVVRRRIPAVLARYEAEAAEDALLAGIRAPRFEVRYRSAIALVRRRRAERAASAAAARQVWAAVREEVSRERPVWEYQRVLDDDEPPDDLVASRLGSRGQLSLEHSFRLLSLVLDREAVSSAYHGLASNDDRLRSLALEYLDQVLPADIRHRLWPFIGDLSEIQRARDARSLEEVVSDLVTTGATYFADLPVGSDLRELLERERERRRGAGDEDVEPG